MNLVRHPLFALLLGKTLAIWLVCCAVPTAPAQQSSVNIERVSIGFNGKFKVGHWTTVRLDLVAGEQPFSGTMALEIPDAEGGPCVWTGKDEEPIQLSPGQKTTVSRLVKFGRLENRLAVILKSVEGASLRIALDSQISSPEPTTVRHAIHIGPAPDWNAMSKQRRSVGREAAEVILVSQISELPDSPLGYSGIDFVSLATSDWPILQSISDRQRTALIEWVNLGGRLLLFSGRNGEANFGENGLFAVFAPGKFQGVVRHTSTKSMEGLLRAEVRLDSVTGSRDRDFGLPLSLFADYRGRVILDEAGEDGKNRPIAISSTAGLGQVTYVGLDLDQFPFSADGDKPGWANTPALLEKLVDDVMGHAAKNTSENRGDNLGYADLAGQLQTALDQFPGVYLVPFSALVALIIGYLLVTTVADYFFLKRVIRRMHWTWLTFPIAATLFCIAAFGLARSLRSDQAKARQVEMVDIDSVTGTVRGRTWLHIYSPATDAFNVEYARPEWPGLAKVESALSWHGMPGKGVSGMDRRSLASVFDDAYVQTPPGVHSRVVGMPIQYASSRRLMDEWSAQVNLTKPSELKTEDGVYLRGSFENPFPQAIDGVLLLYRNSAYRFSGELAPGGRQFVDPSDTPLNLNWMVTQRRTVETRDVSTPWDPTSEDIPRLIEMLSLHETAGAEAYTGISNRYYRSLDFTEQTSKGVAILVGRVKQPFSAPTIEATGSRSKITEAIESWTFVRVLLPVANVRQAR